MRIAELPADLVAVPEGGAEVLILKAGVLTRVSPDGSGTRSLGLRPSRGYGPTPNLWFWTDVDPSGAVGALWSYAPGSSTTALDARAATDAFATSPGGGSALGVTHLRDHGMVPSSTRTATLEWLPIAGPPRALVEGISLGRWDQRTRQHACGPQLEIMSETRALAVVCTTPGSDERSLLAIDVETSSVTVVARGVMSFLRASEDRSFALFLDPVAGLSGVSADGREVGRLAETRAVTSLALLEGARFAYTTSARDISIAEWPALVPRSVLPLGADTLEAVSPDGRYLMFRQARAPTGLRDLFVLDTTTASAAPSALARDTDAYPGDEAFSEDGAWAQWFARADANFIGTITVQPTAGGPPRAIAERGWILLNHADPERLVVLANARFEGEGRRLRVDLSVPKRDGTQAEAIVTGIDPAAFELFPERDRAAFRIAEGAQAGLWVRELR